MKNRKGDLGAMRREGLGRQSLKGCFPARGKKKGASQRQAGKREETPALRGRSRSMAERGQPLGWWAA